MKKRASEGEGERIETLIEKWYAPYLEDNYGVV